MLKLVIPREVFITTMDELYHSGIQTNKDKLRRLYEEHLRLRFPSSRCDGVPDDLFSELVLMDEYIAGTVRCYLDGYPVNIKKPFYEDVVYKLIEECDLTNDKTLDIVQDYVEYIIQLNKMMEILYKVKAELESE